MDRAYFLVMLNIESMLIFVRLRYLFYNARSTLQDNPDPSNPPNPGWNKEYIRWRLRRIVESLLFRTFTMILIVIDVIIVIIDLVENKGANQSFNPYQLVDLLITIWFVIELVLRIVALTPQTFFSR